MSLTDEELSRFFHELDSDKDGYVSPEDFESAVSAFEEKMDIQKAVYARYIDAKGVFPKERYSKEQFCKIVKKWSIPTLSPSLNMIEGHAREYESKLSIGRRLRAHWSVEGYLSTFVALVVTLQIGLAVWLLIKELTNTAQLHLLGWGLVLAKTSAGVLYPTVALTILSSSRQVATFLRQWQFFSRFINWDLSQSFHIRMAIITIFFTMLHVIGHLSGTFVHLARSSTGAAKEVLPNFHQIRPSYASTMRTLPAITGTLSASILILISLCSIPIIRRKQFEVFQSVHLLVYPLMGLLMAHGTRGWLQAPMLGYWLALPTAVVLYERGYRLVRSFETISAERILQDPDTVVLILKRKKPWKFLAGQYVLLRVPTISRFQWHPFTVSSGAGKTLVLHIRTTSGVWTSAIRTTPFEYVNVDGPFGAPAQRFHDFDRTMVIGAGIGITPYAGILADMEVRRHAGKEGRKSRVVDFHWIVRDNNSFTWFSGLLNEVIEEDEAIKVFTYLTSRSKSITEHVCCVFFDRFRTPQHPASCITGLTNMTNFTRPNFEVIMRENRNKVPPDFRGSIGVFFCGPKYVGMEIADRCSMMTALDEQKRIKWEFISEVF